MLWDSYDVAKLYDQGLSVKVCICTNIDFNWSRLLLTTCFILRLWEYVKEQSAHDKKIIWWLHANMDQSSGDDKIIAISAFVVKTLIQKGAADNKKWITSQAPELITWDHCTPLLLQWDLWHQHVRCKYIKTDSQAWKIINRDFLS